MWPSSQRYRWELQYIEFNSAGSMKPGKGGLCWAGLELLDKPDNFTDIPKPVVLHGEGASI